MPVGVYERSSELRERISKSLKNYYHQNPRTQAEKKQRSKTLKRYFQSPEGTLARINMSKNRRGKNHSQWKGGKKASLGYIKVYKPNHPMAQKGEYVLEHRLIMEKILGRPLKPYEVVHHIDGNKKNNKPSNLMLFRNQSEHFQMNKNAIIPFLLKIIFYQSAEINRLKKIFKIEKP